MDYEEINELKTKIFELEVENYVQDIKVRSLAKLLETKAEGQNTGNGRLFVSALQETERFYSNEILKMLSDDYPDMATKIKKVFDKAFPKETEGA